MSDKGHELTDKKLAELEKKLKAHYKQASDEVQKKLDDYLKAFKAKDARHLADLQKDFTKENYEEYIRWRKGQVLISERWEEMRQSLAEDYHHANMEAKSIIDGYMPDIYALNHNYGTYDVEHNALVDTSYTLYDRQTVERLMRDDPDMLPPPGKKVSKRIAEGKDMLWNKSMIQSSMWQSITQGESMDKIAERLAQTVGDKDMAAAVRNARTMTTGAECAGRVDSYKRAQSMGIHLQQEWMATLDGRTRHTHRQLHGECIDVGGTFSNGCRFPGDPHGPAEEVYNCRCTLVSAIKGFEGDKVTYSPKLGEQSFEEWQNEHKKGLDNSGESGIIDLQKQLVDLGFDSIDQSFFNNVNKEMQHSIIDQLSYLENKFSAIGNSNKITISADLRGGATACVRSELNSPNNQKLMLSSRDFKNRKRHISNRKKEVEDFFCMPCNMDEETLSRYVITHEYGHMLENTIAAQDMRGTINTFPRLTANYKEQIERIARTIDPDYDSNKSKYISRYVREEVPNGKKDLEFFAECFANSQLGQPNVLGQAMLQWLEKRGF